MDMLSEQDFKRIGEGVGRVIEDNVLPRVEEMLDERFKPVLKRLDGVDNKLDGIERRLDRNDGKINALVNVLQLKRVITGPDKEAILV